MLPKLLAVGSLLVLAGGLVVIAVAVGNGRAVPEIGQVLAPLGVFLLICLGLAVAAPQYNRPSRKTYLPEEWES